MSVATFARCAQRRRTSLARLERLFVFASPNATDTTATSTSCTSGTQLHARCYSTSRNSEQGQQALRCFGTYTVLVRSISSSSNQYSECCCSQTSQSSHSTNVEELRKFAELADEWWNPQGPFKPLHAMNPVRCKFLRDALCHCFKYADH